MWLLLAACTPPPPPSLTLPPLPVVTHAEPVSVDRFLSATALGAKDALLCPWFRGETVPDASLARWTTEARLAWLVLDVGADGATLAGNADVAARAAEARAAAETLKGTCGAERPVEVLVTAGPDTPREAVTGALATLDATLPAETRWIAVADPSPAPLAPTGASATCGAAAAAASWGGTLAAVDGLRAAGVARVTLGDTTEAPLTAAPAMAGPASSVPLHGQIAAVPLAAPCVAGAPGCPCEAAPAAAPEAPVAE